MAGVLVDEWRSRRGAEAYEMRTDFLTLTVASMALVAIGCVASEHSAFVKARRAYRECVEAHPDDRESCSHLEAQYHSRAEEYGDHAARSWGCTNTPDRCDEPRR
jgi:hypothetical protein